MAIGTNNKVDPNAPIGKQKKKKHVGLWVTLSVLLVVIVLPICLLYGCFFDSSHIDTGVTGDPSEYQPSEVFKSTICDIVECCDPSVYKTGKPTMDIVVTEKMLNEVLYYATKQIPDQVKSFVPQIAFQILEKQYLFDIELNAYNFFKTHVKLDLNLKANEVIATQANKKGFIFEVSNVTIGRIGGLRDIAHNIFDKTGLLDTVASVFTNIGLNNLVFEKDNHRFVYTYDGFVEDIGKMVGTGSTGDVTLLIGVLSELLNKTDASGNPFFNFTHTPKVEIRGSGDVTEFKTNSLLCNDSYFRNFKSREKADKIITAIKSHQASGGGQWGNEELLKLVQFVSYGNNVNSSLLTDSVITGFFITSNPASVGSERRKTILGTAGNDDPAYAQDELEQYCNQIKNEYFATTVDLKSILEQQIVSQCTEEFRNAVIAKVMAHDTKISFDQIMVSDEQLKSQFVNCGVMGLGSAFSKGYADTYDFNFMMVSDLYTTLRNDSINFVLGFDLNGTTTSMIMPMTKQACTESGKLTFKSGSDVYWGSYKCGKSISDVFNSYKSELEKLTIPGIVFKNGDMTIDCDSYIQQGLDNSPKFEILGVEYTIDSFARINGYSRFATLNTTGPTSSNPKGYVTVDISYTYVGS